MSACEHVVQIYEDDEEFVDALGEFIGRGLVKGHGAVVIATPAHRQELDRRLTRMGIDVTSAMANDRFLSLDAEETLATFATGGSLDEAEAAEQGRQILERARRGGREIRVAGEMAPLLWVRGYYEAAVTLERMWNQLSQVESFPVFCAYPRRAFTQSPPESLARICAEHSAIFSA